AEKSLPARRPRLALPRRDIFSSPFFSSSPAQLASPLVSFPHLAKFIAPSLPSQASPARDPHTGGSLRRGSPANAVPPIM
uniref:Uncharacterized protein n=1 Tax=Aegilops tauschii subsp. strangulata TaxID=200361 RepID=A0A453MHJ3_AEGTS